MDANSTRDSALIIAEGLGKSFDETVAVRDLSFDVGAGTILGLLGPNGAGKTTTVNMLTTLLEPDTGTASVAGFDVRRQRRQVRQSIGLAGQSAAVDEKLTGRENLTMFGDLYHMPRRLIGERTEELLEAFGLRDLAERRVSTYSGGERRRLDLAASLIAEPPALFLDEPTTGVDPRTRAEIWALIRRLADAGAAVVLTTQYLEEADRIADELIVIDKGAAIASGTPKQLKDMLGRDVLEIDLADASDAALERAAGVLAAESGATGETLAAQGGRLRIRLDGGASESLAALRALDTGEIEIADFQLRRPTLDDVFLTLTDAEEGVA